MLPNCARLEASQPSLCLRGVSSSHSLHLGKCVVCHCLGKKQEQPSWKTPLIPPCTILFPWASNNHNSIELSPVASSWEPWLFLRAPARGGCTSAYYPAQIYFATEHGPEISEMKMSLLAGPWRRILLKKDK